MVAVALSTHATQAQVLGGASFIHSSGLGNFICLLFGVRKIVKKDTPSAKPSNSRKTKVKRE